MSSFRDYFAGKKVTIIGLGLLGRGVGDAQFIAECGADLIVTDLRDEKTLQPSLLKLKKYKDIKFVLGEHRLEDFRNRDFILKAAGVPLDSAYIAEARKNGIPIEMDASLFAKLMPKGVTLLGVTGTRGKSTVTALIYEILQGSTLIGKKVEPCRIYKGGNLVPEATLPLLKKVRAGDIVVLELDSWQLQGFGESKISPNVSVFTNFMPDHMTHYKGSMTEYFKDKAAIFKYQKKGEVLIVGEEVAKMISQGSTLNRPNRGFILNPRSPEHFAPQNVLGEKDRTFAVARPSDIPADWNPRIIGEHNRYNIACALAAARALKIPDAISRKVIENFKGIPGRLEYLHTVRGVKIYNDNHSTTPEATMAALHALGSSTPTVAVEVELPLEPRIVLIMGGTDKGLDMTGLISEIEKTCKAVVLLKETGSDKLIFNDKFPIFKKETLKGCVGEAMKLAKKGDTVLFSPTFASFGKWFKNEYDRGEQFVKLTKRL